MQYCNPKDETRKQRESGTSYRMEGAQNDENTLSVCPFVA